MNVFPRYDDQVLPLETHRRSTAAWHAKHERILLAAMEEFIGHGFEGASMDLIAAKAKVSKVTIYNHFESKDLLYRQMVDHYLASVHPDAPRLKASVQPPGDELRGYALAVIGILTMPSVIGMIRLLRADRENAAQRLMPDPAHLAAFLANETVAGRMLVDRPEVAARQLFGMLFENTVYPALSGQEVDLSQGHVEALVDSCLVLFLVHYST